MLGSPGLLSVFRVVRSFSIAFITVALAVLCVAGTYPLWVSGSPPWGVFVLPVLASAWLGDTLAIAFATLLGILTAAYLVPGGGFSHLDIGGYVRIVIFVSISGSVAVLVRRARGSERLERNAAMDLRQADERLRQALDAAQMVAWRWDPATDLITRTGRVRELFGVEPVGRGRSFYDLVHPLDRDRYRQVVRDAIARKSGFDVVFRFVRPDRNDVVWVEKRAAPLEAPGGGFGGFTGVAQDVTDRFDLQAAIRVRDLQLRVIMDAVPALIAYVDDERRYGIVNRAYQDWFGGGSESISGRSVSDVLGAEYFETLRPHVDAALSGQQVEFETEMAHRDGSLRVLRAAYVPDVDEGTVRGFFVLVLDITHDRRREQALTEAEREARLANDLKDQFLATLSHELRTPLNAMLGYARMAQVGVVPAERAVEVIERNAGLQARLVEDLLDVSRMVSGKLQFTMGDVDLSGIAGDVVYMLKPLAEAKSVRLSADVPAVPGPPVTGDETRLRQMLVNLVSNAVKFTPEGGGVIVRLRQQPAAVDLSVDDTGIGISQDLLPVIFDRFRQADSSATREHGGLGLGLSIARTIAEAHGGTIAAASDGPGCGATFTVRLPLDAHAAARVSEVQVS